MNTGKKTKLNVSPYFYLVPCMLVFAVFLFYPFFKTIFLSLFLTDRMGQAKIFVGLQNYIELLTSASFQNSLKVCCDSSSRRNAAGADRRGSL